MRNISDEDLRARDTERFGQLLMALGRRAPLRDPIASTCEEFNITPAQIHAVMWLGIDGSMAMGELAKLLRTTEKTVTGLVDRLERE
ncbi:MAG: MarR family transcriptional regulator, partial [Myxococcaceae bacterium]